MKSAGLVRIRLGSAIPEPTHAVALPKRGISSKTGAIQ